MYKIGLDAKLKINDAEFKDTKDVTLNLSASLADVSTRASKWRRKQQTLKEATLSFTALCASENDAAIVALRNAFLTGGTVKAETIGASAFAGDCVVASLSEGQPLEDAIAYDVSLELGVSETEPTLGAVTAGTGA